MKFCISVSGQLVLSDHQKENQVDKNATDDYHLFVIASSLCFRCMQCLPIQVEAKALSFAAQGPLPGEAQGPELRDISIICHGASLKAFHW